MAWQQQEESTELVIATPHRGDVSFRWATTLASLEMPAHVISSKSTASLDLAREQTIENAMENNPEWVLFLDSDIIPPKDVFARLMEHDLDFVSALYVVDKKPPHMAAWAMEDDGLSPVQEWHDNSLINVDAVGLGCALVNRRVFEDIERPWFRWTEGFDSHPWDLKDNPQQKGVGEDFYFCHKVQEAGYNIYVDTSVECLHEKPGYLTTGGFKPVTHQKEEERNGR